MNGRGMLLFVDIAFEKSTGAAKPVIHKAMREYNLDATI